MKYVIGNWKSNKSEEEVKIWLKEFAGAVAQNSQVKIIIAPPFPFLRLAANTADQVTNLELAVQDLSPFPAGSYTGAISTHNLEGLGVKYAIVGHSERRRYFKETNQDVANKVERCLEAEITPIVCVDDDYISSQAFAIKKEYLTKCMVAYEALGAIGSGQSTPVDKVKKVYGQIEQEFGSVKLIYGGSVTSQNVVDYLAISDGVLVGEASLKIESFLGLIER